MPKPIKAKGTGKMLIVEVKAGRKSPPVLRGVETVSRLPTDLGINVETNVARIGVRVDPTGKITTVGLNKVIGNKRLAKEGRCSL